jgi:hypothetical protein
LLACLLLRRGSRLKASALLQLKRWVLELTRENTLALVQEQADRSQELKQEIMEQTLVQERALAFGLILDWNLVIHKNNIYLKKCAFNAIQSIYSEYSANQQHIWVQSY